MSGTWARSFVEADRGWCDVTIDWSGLNVRSRHVSAEVTRHLEQVIVTGELPPGARVPPEREIAGRLGVSRSSVREAMHELTLKGLVERKPGRGTIVVGPGDGPARMLGVLNETDRRLLEVTDLRQVVEPSVAGRAASRATPSDLARMEEVLTRSAAAAELSPERSLLLDEEFHLLVARAAQNGLLAALAEQLTEWMHDVRLASHATAEGRTASLAGHREIYAAIRDSDPAAAQAAMSAHVAEIDSVLQRHRH